VAKLYVTAVAAWVGTTPELIVSVESTDGTPLAALTQKSFEVGRQGDGSIWAKQKITGFYASGKGFYTLVIGFNSVGSQSFPWQAYQADTVFTVAVTSNQDRGQALAINRCCGDDGVGTKLDRTAATSSAPSTGARRRSTRTAR
jgi:hypothetical protein